MTEKAVKSLQKIPRADVDNFLRKINIIKKDPYAQLSFVKRLKNSQNFRFRFGDYRGVYNIVDKILTITVIDVAHRKDIYIGGINMAAFQIISEKDKPKFVVLPFGGKKAVQDYMDELWAEKAIADFEKSKPKKLYSLDDVKEKLKKKEFAK